MLTKSKHACRTVIGFLPIDCTWYVWEVHSLRVAKQSGQTTIMHLLLPALFSVLF